MKNKVNVQEVRSGLQDRRSFLRISGLALAGTGLLIAGCSDDDDGGNNNNTVPGPGVINGTFDLGGGDLGILTYAYALEQLEANFYDRVVNNGSFGTIFSNEEREILADLYNHEVIHREFFKAALTGAVSRPEMVLPTLEFNFQNVNFGNRLSVLETAKVLEDTGVAAYNGAGRYIADANYLLLAGKIVSVEARHASAIRDLLNPGSADFAGNDVVDGDGLDLAMKPSQIVPMVDPFITTQFTARYLP